MPDVEKVNKGFECCHAMVHDLGLDKTSCGICPYKDAQTEEQIDLGGIECIAVLHDDARELVKRQQETIASLQDTICKLSATLGEQPEQKRGHWMYGWTCSVCKERLRISLDGRAPIFEGIKCCPNCGAKMEG